jgi:hypothetical protein
MNGRIRNLFVSVFAVAAALTFSSERALADAEPLSDEQIPPPSIVKHSIQDAFYKKPKETPHSIQDYLRRQGEEYGSGGAEFDDSFGDSFDDLGEFVDDATVGGPGLGIVFADDSLPTVDLSVDRSGFGVSGTGTLGATPTPGALTLIGLGTLGLLNRRRRR